MKKYILFVFFAALANAASSQIVINSQNVESVTHSLTGATTAYTVPQGKMLVITNVVFNISTTDTYSATLTIDGISVLRATAGVTHFTDVNITAGEQEVIDRNGWGTCVINGYLVTL